MNYHANIIKSKTTSLVTYYDGQVQWLRAKAPEPNYRYLNPALPLHL